MAEPPSDTRDYVHYGPYTPTEKKEIIMDQMRMLGRPARQHEIRAMIRYRLYMERGMSQRYVKILTNRMTVHLLMEQLNEEGRIGRIKPDCNHVFWYLTEQAENAPTGP